MLTIENYTFFAHNRKVMHRRAPKTFGGVGIFVKNSIFVSFDVSIIDEEIDGIQGIQLIEKVSGFSIIVYNCYLPPVNSVYCFDNNDFFGHLTQQLYLHSECDIVIICGDFNARTGNLKDIISEIDNVAPRVNVDDVIQGHGEEFIEFVKDSRLCILNGRFNPLQNNYTFISDKGKSVVDYIITPHDCLHMFGKFEVWTMGYLAEKFDIVHLISANCKLSDHSMLYTKFKIGSENDMNNTNIETLYGNGDVQVGSYCQYKKRKYFFDEIPEEFMNNPNFLKNINDSLVIQLCGSINGDILDSAYNQFSECVIKEMDQYLKYIDLPKTVKKSTKNSKPFWNCELYQLWKIMREAEKFYVNFKGSRFEKENMRKEYVFKRKIFDKTLRKREREYNRGIINNIEVVCTKNPKDFWKFVKKLGPRKCNKIPLTVYNENGELCENVEYVLNKWKSDFSNLLNRPEDNLFDNEYFETCMSEKEILENNLVASENDEYISLTELRYSLNKLRNNKTTGIDNIPNEILKMESIFTQLHFFMNKVFSNHMNPSNWKKIIISPIPKCPTKDVNIPLNYRGISLISCVAKLFSAIINSKIVMYCENNQLLCDEQNGFRKKRSCEDHIFVLTSIIRNRLKDNESTYCAFIDMQKAFDWVDRKMLFYTLLKKGLNYRLYHCVKSIYENSMASIKVNQYYTDWFYIESGVRQGDPLSPTLFSLFINELVVIVNSLNLGVEIEDKNVSILAFADDIVLIAKNTEELQKILKEVENWCKKFRLLVNTDKTKIVHFRQKRKVKTSCKFMFNNADLEIVDKYKYLGVMLNEHMNFNLLTNTLASAAGRALSGIISKFKSLKNVGFHTYETLYFSNVVPIADYASGVWGFESFSEAEKLHYRAIRYFLGVHCKAPLLGMEGDIGWQNCKVRHRVNMIRYWNRLIRMDEDRLTRKVFEWDYKRKHCWTKEIYAIFNSVGLSDLYEQKLECDLKCIEKKLMENRNNEWYNLLALKPKLRTYRKFKDTLGCEDYVYLDNRKRRSQIAQLRLGILPINIEVGRFRNLQVDERLCEVCNSGQIEDEFHFVMVCSAYDGSREKLLAEVQIENFSNMSSQEKFIYLMKYENRKLSRYIDEAWNIRRSKLYIV